MIERKTNSEIQNIIHFRRVKSGMFYKIFVDGLHARFPLHRINMQKI